VRWALDFGVGNTTATIIVNDRSERRTPFTTDDYTGSETTVVLGLQQLWSDAKWNTGPY